MKKVPPIRTVALLSILTNHFLFRSFVLADTYLEARREQGFLLEPLVITVDNKKISLDIRPDLSAHDNAMHFCRKHNILPAGCNELVAHIAGLLRPDSPVEQAAPTNNLQHESRADDPEPHPPSSSSIHSDSDEDREHDLVSGVDYSRRVGPTLDITILDKSVNETLQCYVGESPSQAAARFCLKHRLDESDCAVVIANFLPRHGLDVPNSLASRREYSSPRHQVGPWQTFEAIVGPIWSDWAWQTTKATVLVLVLCVYAMHWRDEAAGAGRMD